MTYSYPPPTNNNKKSPGLCWRSGFWQVYLCTQPSNKIMGQPQIARRTILLAQPKRSYGSWLLVALFEVFC